MPTKHCGQCKYYQPITPARGHCKAHAKPADNQWPVVHGADAECKEFKTDGQEDR
jgi:hypothetical protein